MARELSYQQKVVAVAHEITRESINGSYRLQGYDVELTRERSILTPWYDVGGGRKLLKRKQLIVTDKEIIGEDKEAISLLLKKVEEIFGSSL